MFNGAFRLCACPKFVCSHRWLYPLPSLDPEGARRGGSPQGTGGAHGERGGPHGLRHRRRCVHHLEAVRPPQRPLGRSPDRVGYGGEGGRGSKAWQCIRDDGETGGWRVDREGRRWEKGGVVVACVAAQRAASVGNLATHSKVFHLEEKGLPACLL